MNIHILIISLFLAQVKSLQNEKSLLDNGRSRHQSDKVRRKYKKDSEDREGEEKRRRK